MENVLGVIFLFSFIMSFTTAILALGQYTVGGIMTRVIKILGIVTVIFLVTTMITANMIFY